MQESPTLACSHYLYIFERFLIIKIGVERAKQEKRLVEFAGKPHPGMQPLFIIIIIIITNIIIIGIVIITIIITIIISSSSSSSNNNTIITITLHSV